MKKYTAACLALAACIVSLGASQPLIKSETQAAPPSQPTIPPNHPAVPPSSGGQPQAPALPGLPSGHPAPGQVPAGHPPMPGENPELVLSPDWPLGKPEDVKSVDAIVTAYYATVSGAKGEARDWNRLRSLMLPETQLFSTRLAGNRLLPIVLKIDDYIEANRKYFEKGGYYEKEVNRKTDIFGNIAQVFSTYESRRHLEEHTPYSRGLNSFQLVFDGERWWIASVLWGAETQASPIPAQYLPPPSVLAPTSK
ncbi:MAG: hypothetical protein JNL80_13070 [Phycisphaerae bacterium]|nr:hypothetical protein [Phycisphaerae bacterium]